MKTNQNQKRILLGGLSAFLLVVLGLVAVLLWQGKRASDEVAYDSIESEEVSNYEYGANYIRLPYSNDGYARNADLSFSGASPYGDKEIIRIIEVIPHPLCSIFPFFVEWGDNKAYNENLPVGAPGILAIAASISGDADYQNYLFHSTQGWYTRRLRDYDLLGDPRNGDYNVPMGSDMASWGYSVSDSAGGAYYRSTATSTATSPQPQTGLRGYFEFVGWTDRLIANHNNQTAYSSGPAGLYYLNITHVNKIATDNAAARGTAAGTGGGINYKRQAVPWTNSAGAANNGEFYVVGPLYYYPDGTNTNYVGSNAYTAKNYDLSFSTTVNTTYPQAYAIVEGTHKFNAAGGYDYDVADSELAKSEAGYAYVSTSSDKQYIIAKVTEVYDENEPGYDKLISALSSGEMDALAALDNLYIRVRGGSDGCEALFDGTVVGTSSMAELKQALAGHLEKFDPKNPTTAQLGQYACQLFLVEFTVAHVHHRHTGGVGVGCVDKDGLATTNEALCVLSLCVDKDGVLITNPANEDECVLLTSGHYRPLPKADFKPDDYKYEYVGQGKGRFDLIFEPLEVPTAASPAVDPYQKDTTIPKVRYYLKDVLKVSRGNGRYHLAATKPSGSTGTEVAYARRGTTAGDNVYPLDYADYVTNIDWNGNVVTGTGTNANGATDNAAGGGVRIGGTTATGQNAQIAEYGAWVFVPLGAGQAVGETMLKEVIPDRANNGAGIPDANSNGRPGTVTNPNYHIPLGTRIYVSGQTLTRRYYTRQDFYNNEWLKLRMLMDNPINIYRFSTCNAEFNEQAEQGNTNMDLAHCATPFNQVVRNDGTYTDGVKLGCYLPESEGGQWFEPEYIGYDGTRSGEWNVFTGPDSAYTRYMLREFDRQFQIEIIQMSADQLTPAMVYGTETKFVYIAVSPGVNALVQHWTAMSNSRVRYGLSALPALPAGLTQHNANTYFGEDAYKNTYLDNLPIETMYALYDAAVINPGEETGIGLLMDTELGENDPWNYHRNDYNKNNMAKLYMMMSLYYDGCNDPAHLAGGSIVCPRHQKDTPWNVGGANGVNLYPYSRSNPGTNNRNAVYVPQNVVTAHYRNLNQMPSPSLEDGFHAFQYHMWDMYPDKYKENYTRIYGTDGRAGNGGTTGPQGNSASAVYANVSANKDSGDKYSAGYNVTWAATPSVNNEQLWSVAYFMPVSSGVAHNINFNHQQAGMGNGTYVPGSAYMFAGQWLVDHLFAATGNHNMWEIFRIRRVNNPSRTPTIKVVPLNAEYVGGRYVINVNEDDPNSAFQIDFHVEGTNITENIIVHYEGASGPTATSTLLPSQLREKQEIDGALVKPPAIANRPTYKITISAESGGVSDSVEVWIIVKSIFNLT